MSAQRLRASTNERPSMLERAHGGVYIFESDVARRAAQTRYPSRMSDPRLPVRVRPGSQRPGQLPWTDQANATASPNRIRSARIWKQDPECLARQWRL